MTPKLTTFGQVQEDIAQYEQQQSTPVDTPAPAAEIPTNIPIDVPQDTPAPDTPPEVVAESPTVAEEVGSSSFSIALEGEETPTDSGAAPAAVQPASFDWKAEIKKVDKSELLKELGFNEFALELNEHLSRGGNAIDYLNAKAIDYNQVSDEALIKEDLRKQYPTLTPSQVELMYNRRYNVSEDAMDEDREFVEIQKKADAHKLRSAKIQEQQSFKIPESSVPQKDEAYEQWKQYKEESEAYVEKLTKFFVEHPATKSLNESKRVAIDLGKDVPAFNFNIDRPELITQTFTDGGKIWQKITSTATGEPDVQKQQLISLFAFNPSKFMQEIFNYGQQMGVRNKIVAEGQNAQKPQAVVMPLETKTTTYSSGRFGDRAR